VSTISNTEKEYQKEISERYNSPLGRIWWKIGIKMGYLKSYWKIRLKYFNKLSS
tara:strand:+ start:1457 stop:1618 length:162 start_codon:yes stop_codon:yes gene_type:complete